MTLGCGSCDAMMESIPSRMLSTGSSSSDIKSIECGFGSMVYVVEVKDSRATELLLTFST